MPTSAPGALAGVRVLDLTRLLPGPFATQLLADLGADVVKVEDPGQGDYARWSRPQAEGHDPSTASVFFAALNRNKRSVRLDLKHPDGLAVLLDLAAGADVLLEGFRPGVLERLGAGYDVLLGRNPALVICPITGYGLEGPMRDRPGHDLNYLAAVGLLDLGGEAGGPPAMPAVQIADIGGGALLAAFGVLAALRHAERTGEGQVVDVSMAHGALAWLGGPAAEILAGGRGPVRGALTLGGGVLCYRVYACADGHVTLGALERKFFAAFCAGIGRDDLLDAQFDRPGSPAHAELEAIFAGRTRAEWAAFDAQHQCCLEPVRTLGEALDSELVRARGMVATLAGEPARRALGSPLTLSRTPADAARLPVPALGEHTDELLAELGYDASRVAALHEAGAVTGRTAHAPTEFMGSN